MKRTESFALNLLASFLAAAAGTYLAEFLYWKKPYGKRLPKCLQKPYDPAVDEARGYYWQ